MMQRTISHEAHKQRLFEDATQTLKADDNLANQASLRDAWKATRRDAGHDTLQRMTHFAARCDAQHVASRRDAHNQAMQ